MSISVMLKPSSSNCNLKCEYCFYHSLSSQREQFSKGMMSIETAENVILSALDFAGGSDVYFTFQGGEPLLSSIGFYKDFISIVKNNNNLSSPIHYCLQTNGTLITEEYAKLFKDNGFLIGVSLDGDEELNKYRVYPDGKSSFSDVMNGIEILKKYNVPFNVLSVLTKNTANNFKKAYRFFKQNHLKYMQFITGLRPFDYNGENEELYMNEEDYYNFLKRGFNVYFNDFMRGDNVSIRRFDNYVLLAQGQPAEQCGMNGCCSTQFVVEADGSTYPCDFYCTDEFYLGNINTTSFEDMYNSSVSVEFIKESFKLDDSCKECEYFYLCRGGGCKRNRQDKNYCSAYKRFFNESEFKIKQMRG